MEEEGGRKWGEQLPFKGGSGSRESGGTQSSGLAPKKRKKKRFNAAGAILQGRTCMGGGEGGT